MASVSGIWRHGMVVVDIAGGLGDILSTRKVSYVFRNILTRLLPELLASSASGRH